MFDKFNKLGQMIRKNPNRPFGGMQIIVTGDFFQLPPVTKGGAQPKFCFDAQTWAETISMSVNLTKVFRQKDQRKLLGVLAKADDRLYRYAERNAFWEIEYGFYRCFQSSISTYPI